VVTDTAEVTAGAFSAFQAQKSRFFSAAFSAMGQCKPRLELTLFLLTGCHVTRTMLPFRSEHCQNSLCSLCSTRQSCDGNNLALLCLGNRGRVWGKSHPQSCSGPFPKIGVNVQARYLSFYFDEIPELGFMHVKYFL